MMEMAENTQRHQFEPTLNVNLELKIKDCSDMCSNNRPKGCFPVTRFYTHVHARKRLNPFLYQFTKLQMNSCFDVEKFSISHELACLRNSMC